MDRVKTKKMGQFGPFDERLDRPFVCQKIPSICDRLPSIGPFVGLNHPPVPQRVAPKPQASTGVYFARNQAGLTLIELLVTVAVAAILLIMCRSADPTAAAPTCGGTANDWSSGWLLYATPGNVNERDYNSATDILIRVGAGTTGGVRITSNNTGNSWLTFNADGTLRKSGTAVYAICDDNDETTGRLITIPRTGRPTISHTTPTTTNTATDCTPT
jgi:prepilin-type N-terminal cleavage/methylation domain-containing protein